MTKRIGIYAGAFDPVHSGHIAFALQAAKAAKLDLVVFMPERRPRYKPDVTHFGHRTAMIARAVQPHAKLALLELPDMYFSFKKTLPKLRKEFKDAQLAMLMGSDVVASLKNWPGAEQLLEQSELVIGLREGQRAETIMEELEIFDLAPKVTIIKSLEPGISSGKIRQALRQDSSSAGLLDSVRGYARNHWLYTSLEKS